jgi:hypothetical protein
MARKRQAVVTNEFSHRRRASDRARERAGRAAYFGDRAGLLIATSVAASLMSSRTEADQAAIAVMRRRLSD